MDVISFVWTSSPSCTVRRAYRCAPCSARFDDGATPSGIVKTKGGNDGLRLSWPSSRDETVFCTIVPSILSPQGHHGVTILAEAELRRSRDGGLDTAVAEAGLRRNVNGAPTNQLITAVAEEFGA